MGISFLIFWFFTGMTVLVTPLKENFGQVPTYSFEQFEPLINKKNDTTYVINFWATWCAPCVKELPDFEKLNTKFNHKKLKVILVSLDFKRNKESKLLPFVEKNKLRSQIIHLYAPDANAWIDRVNPEWSGSIPATLIYNHNQRIFHEGSYTFDEMVSIIDKLITN